MDFVRLATQIAREAQGDAVRLMIQCVLQLLGKWPVMTRKAAMAAKVILSGCLISSASSLYADSFAPNVDYWPAQSMPAADASAARSSSPLCSTPDAPTLSRIVPITTDRGINASGVVVDKDRVLTAAHALRGAGHFFVRAGQAFRSAELVRIDHNLDLAVLAVDTGLLMPLPVLNIVPAPSDLLWAAGYPSAQAMVLSRGVLQSAADGVLNTSATIDSGQSGGGLLSCFHGNWFLAGMLRGFGVYEQSGRYVKVEHLSMAVAGAVINRFLEE